jgi:hypothetical protein
MQNTIERIERFVKKIADGSHDRIKPGEPYTMNGALTVGNAADQGDLIIEIVADVREGIEFTDQNNRRYKYAKVAKPKASDKQLVVGNTEGAKHCLNTIAGVEMFRPTDWNAESLLGPCIRINKTITVLHPKHGNVTIEASKENPRCILFSYQRNLDLETQREIRARD